MMTFNTINWNLKATILFIFHGLINKSFNWYLKIDLFYIAFKNYSKYLFSKK